MQRYLFLKIMPAVLLLAGCSRGKKIPDVSHIPVNVHISRFDQQLFRIDTNNVGEGIKLLAASFPDFAPAYFLHIMNFGPLADSNRYLQPQVRQFLTNKDFRALQDSVNAHFKNIQSLEKELTQAFRLMKYYLPKFRVPEVVSFTSAISNYSAITVDSILGIGLDMHMGADFPVYRMIPDYPDYIIRRFTPENIPVNVIKVLQQDLYPSKEENSELIELMIDLGRQQYCLELVLPEHPEALRLGYTKEQLDFCNSNEAMIWEYFIQHKLLYTTDWQDIARYTGEGPSTQGMPGEVPGQIGVFVGYKIVQQYMEKHPETTLEQLLQMQDRKKIFNGSKYRP